MDQGEPRQRNQGGKAGDARTRDNAIAMGPAAVPSALALAFLTGKSELSDAALVGLHQTLVAPALVARVVSASKAGARLAANVDVQGKSLRQVVQDAAFDWGAGAAGNGQESEHGHGHEHA